MLIPFSIDSERYITARIYKTPTDCWEWTLYKDKDGYGKCKFAIEGLIYYQAHRLAYRVWNGPLHGLSVCHTCDNPSCCNPLHLFAGTHRDNMLDRSAKGRWKGGRYPDVSAHNRILEVRKTHSAIETAVLCNCSVRQVYKIIEKYEKTNLKSTHRTGRNVNPILD